MRAEPLAAPAATAPRTAGYPWERPLGAHPLADGRARFRVWAPRARSAALRLGGRDVELEDAGYGIYEAAPAGAAGDDYWFVLDGVELPDPCSRWQPCGLRGPSRVLDPLSPAPLSASLSLEGLVIYELHIGTFSEQGTFAGAIPHLAGLAELGIDAIEIMPVAEFPGRHGWGYDGVYLSAAQSSYGGPHGLLELVEAAHDHGLAVILDVVYNHVGASGTQALEAFGPYFTDTYGTPWGRAINYDGGDCDPVREWVLQSAEGWVRDFAIDGLRLDAIHAIFDSSAEHIVQAIARRVHEVAPGALVIAESGLNDPRVMRTRARGGYECDAAWADDFHHALRTLVTDERDGYFVEFGRVAQLAKALHRPHVHDGGYSSFRRRRFGESAEDVPVERFVVFSQNHDQVGNRAFGDRMPDDARPLAALCTLLVPYVALLFMGEEYGEKAPFQFFSDHIDKEIANATREGRRQEFASFASFARAIPDPQDPATFERSKLTREAQPELARLYAKLLRVRRKLPKGDADKIEFDETDRWLRVRRGWFEIVCNFASEVRSVPCQGSSVVLCTHGTPQVTDGRIELGPLAGALIR
ncbi:MAG: malto-oligosyltrehalose trehalohydrolase [Actinomycetota bacterium]|nr:malto-oligosyltrehalose trehalohydrolase [Actinomycetota bacterium]